MFSLKGRRSRGQFDKFTTIGRIKIAGRNFYPEIESEHCKIENAQTAQARIAAARPESAGETYFRR
jgi:hypothetical protein